MRNVLVFIKYEIHLLHTFQEFLLTKIMYATVRDEVLLAILREQLVALVLLAHLQAEEPSIVKLQTLQSPLDPGPQHVSQLLVVFHGQVVALVLLAHLQAEEPSVSQLLNLHPLEIL